MIKKEHVLTIYLVWPYLSLYLTHLTDFTHLEVFRDALWVVGSKFKNACERFFRRHHLRSLIVLQNYSLSYAQHNESEFSLFVSLTVLVMFSLGFETGGSVSSEINCLVRKKLAKYFIEATQKKNVVTSKYKVAK